MHYLRDCYKIIQNKEDEPVKMGGCNQATAPLLMKKLSVIIKSQMGILENKKASGDLNGKYKSTKKVIFNSIFKTGRIEKQKQIIMITV